MNANRISRLAASTRVKLKKNAPKILFVGGVVGSVTTVVLSARAGAKSVSVVDILADNREMLDEALSEGAVSEEEHALGVKQEYVRAGVEFTKLYLPVAVVGVGSLIALTKSHQMLSQRNAALTVAFSSLHQAFMDYRERARSELGEEKDLEFLHGTVTEQVPTLQDNGKTKVKEIKVLDPMGETPYSYFYDRKNPSWDKDPGYNATFLDSQQKWANIKLQADGFLFLNDVLDLLKIPRTSVGQVVGWRIDGDGDGYVDFGHQKHGEFMAGYEADVWLDFNVDGPILDLI